ncbi:MAG: hypothetical protein A3F17_00260 [Gammaproteobacteria bacterium RIFCSPHIGHO2_12_FULL_41_15]|nr:MAG: hypothetical protein A3F17_00260 [Gammaproteobacteria bacterium RIFCSPHIGHO2_12_FULL_41_15]
MGKQSALLGWIAAPTATCKDVEYLLLNGAKVNKTNRTDKGGIPPLHTATEARRLDLVTLLLQYGANVNQRDSQKRKALTIAAGNNDLEIICILFFYGATGGSTALNKAVQNNLVQMVALLLANQVKMTSTKITPLGRAIENGNISIVQLLLEHGVNVQQVSFIPELQILRNMVIDTSEWFLTPLAMAVNYRCGVSMVNLLLSYGASLDQESYCSYNCSYNGGRFHFTPLTLAVAQGNVEMTGLLLGHQANPASEAALYLLPDAVIKSIPSEDGGGYEGVGYQHFATREQAYSDLMRKNVSAITLAYLMFGFTKKYDRSYHHHYTYEQLRSLLTASSLYESIMVTLIQYGAVPTRLTISGTGKEKETIGAVTTTYILTLTIQVGFTLQELPPVIPGETYYAIPRIIHDVREEARRRYEQYIASPLFMHFTQLSPLQQAISEGKETEAQQLVNKATVNQVGILKIKNAGNGMTALHVAVLNGQDGMVQYLINHGGNVNKITFDRVTPLHIAVQRDSVSTAEILLSHEKIKPNMPLYDGSTPLHLAILNSSSAMTSALLRVKKTQATVTRKDKRTCLHLAVELQNFEQVSLLLNSGKKLNIDQGDIDGQTPLLLAVKHQNEGITNLLLDHKANPNLADNRGRNPLFIAAQYGMKDLVCKLIAYGAKPNKSSKLWGSPLVVAVANNYLSIVVSLLDAGADPNINFSELKTTPLRIAVETNGLLIAYLLLCYGARLKQTTRDGSTVLMIAVKNNNIIMTKLLLAFTSLTDNSFIRLKFKTGTAALHIAVANESSILANLLLAYGAKDIKRQVLGFMLHNLINLDLIKQYTQERERIVKVLEEDKNALIQSIHASNVGLESPDSPLIASLHRLFPETTSDVSLLLLSNNLNTSTIVTNLDIEPTLATGEHTMESVLTHLEGVQLTEQPATLDQASNVDTNISSDRFFTLLTQ